MKLKILIFMLLNFFLSSLALAEVSLRTNADRDVDLRLGIEIIDILMGLKGKAYNISAEYLLDLDFSIYSNIGKPSLGPIWVKNSSVEGKVASILIHKYFSPNHQGIFLGLGAGYQQLTYDYSKTAWEEKSIDRIRSADVRFSFGFLVSPNGRIFMAKICPC